MFCSYVYAITKWEQRNGQIAFQRPCEWDNRIYVFDRGDGVWGSECRTFVWYSAQYIRAYTNVGIFRHHLHPFDTLKVGREIKNIIKTEMYPVGRDFVKLPQFKPTFEPRYMRPWISLCNAQKCNFVAQYVFKIKMWCLQNFCTLLKNQIKQKHKCYNPKTLIFEGQSDFNYIIVVVVLIGFGVSVFSCNW